MKLNCLSILLLFCLRVQATPCLIHHTDFVPADEGLLSLSLPAKIIGASPQIKILDVNGKYLDRCSSSVVSDEGNLLTAGHCIDQCVKGIIAKSDGVSVIDKAKLGQASCQISIDGKVSPMTILATNDCRGKDRLNKNARCHGDDYAVLHIDSQKIGPRPCLNLSTTAPKPGTKVASLGFSAASARSVYRQDAQDSNGTSLQLSKGETIPYQAYCSPATDPDKYSPGPMAFNAENPDDDTTLKRHVDGGNIIQTSNAEFLKGGSGGALIDTATHRIQGVANAFYNNTTVIECRGSTFYNSSASLVAAIKRDYPALDTAKLFNCYTQSVDQGL